ncbi:hypothetical protein OHA61_22245 [Streptomyces sp. NBC_00885]|uniref:hypothetical protein n=1 Tax=Streptomyces sp. NBC_00885 TaxID=2975857 RepID=UPI0038696E68|nr:hypothetical protein OHA61_22245 [Streptomyces sp. NBC_00885]
MILRDAIARFDVEILDHLDHDATLPIVTRAACQGDVSILRVTMAGATTIVSEAGVAVVQGENGGNTHSLHGDGPIMWDEAAPSNTSLTLGILTVPEGSTAILLHPEHGGLAIVPGTYRVGRQREMADVARIVQD